MSQVDTNKFTLKDIYAPIENDLKQFAITFKEELGSEDELIQNIHSHILSMTGKFLRPALTFLTARSGKKFHPDVIKLATAIELIHTATLVHDDIIDDSTLRRNQPAVHTKWGRDLSIISGDYLYAKSFVLLASLKNIWINEAFAKCAHVMCEGEMKQVEKRSDFLMSEAEYLKIIHKKTAALFQAACMGGAYFAGFSVKEIEKFGEYGYNLGMAFQIVDDCLDIIGQTESFGKTVGLDLNKNDVTLPLIYLFQSLEAPERATRLGDFKAGAQGSLEMIRALCFEKKSVERSIEKARLFAQDAIKCLTQIPDSAHKESLIRLAEYCLERVR